MHKSSLLVALVGLVATAHAAEPIVNIVNMDGLAVHLDRRQQNSPSSDSSESSSAPPPSRTTTSIQPTPTQPPVRTTSTSSTRQQPQQTSTPSSPPPETSEKETSTTQDKPSSTSSQPNTRSTITTVPIISSRTQIRTAIITVTRGDGSVVASEVHSSTVEAETVGSQPTTVPNLGQDSGSGSALTDSSKKIIAGVVGGVGGAILLGGLALVAWRMWGRKKPAADDYDDIRSGGGSDSLRAEKRQSNATPFQSTLDQYHTPAPKPNAAANF